MQATPARVNCGEVKSCVSHYDFNSEQFLGGFHPMMQSSLARVVSTQCCETACEGGVQCFPPNDAVVARVKSSHVYLIVISLLSFDGVESSGHLPCPAVTKFNLHEDYGFSSAGHVCAMKSTAKF